MNCRLASTGEIHWTQRLPFAPCWAGCHADLILAAGAEGVACLRRDKGQVIWHFPAPVTGIYPRAPCDDVRVALDPQPPEPLTEFRLASGRLFFLQGQRRLIALNAQTGAVLWDRWAPDGPLRLLFPHGCFSSCYHAGDKTVLIQMSGRRWLLDAATGRQIHESADSRDLWQRPPLAVDERTLCVTMDKRNIVLLDAQTGQSLWTHRLAGVTTLSGEFPSVLGRGNFLLCVQPVNIGYFLQRIDRASGKAAWPRPQLLSAKTLDVDAWTFDADAFYTIEDRLLIARSPVDGAILWQRPLPSDGMKARRVGDYLTVFPQAIGSEIRLRFRLPWAAVQWDLSLSLAPEAVFPLSCYDPKTGQQVQRLHFRIESPRSRDVPVIHLDSPRPFVSAGGAIWGLTEKKTDFTAEAAESAEKKQ